MSAQGNRWGVLVGWAAFAVLATILLPWQLSATTVAQILEVCAGTCLLIWAVRLIRKEPRHRDNDRQH
jgi:hypothetical protein